MNGTSPIRVVICDDHPLFRQGLAELIMVGGECVVVAEAADGHEAIAMVDQHVPDVVILDVEMPGPGAHVTVRELARRQSQMKIVVLSMHDDAALVSQLLDSGAAAYLSKMITRQELLAALYAVMNGGNVILSVSRDTISQLNHGPSEEKVVLSEREHQVLRLATQAYTNSQIGTRLHIAEATVKRHLTNIYAKLGATSRVDAIRKANAIGLVAVDEPS